MLKISTEIQQQNKEDIMTHEHDKKYFLAKDEEIYEMSKK